MLKCIMVAEGEFEGVFEFETQAEITAFGSGISEGSSRYGCGSCGTYDRSDLTGQYCLDPEDHDDAAIIALIKEHIPE